MKRLILLLSAILLLASGCTKTPDPEISISGNPAISIGEDASSATFTFTANRDWSISSTDSWLHFSPASGKASDQSVTVTVTCDPNPGAGPRSAKATIAAGGISKDITVTQPAGIIPVTGITVSPEEATLTPGETVQLTVNVLPGNATDKTVVWSVENATKRSATPIEVSSAGLVTAVEPGVWYAVATCGGVSARSQITVIPKPYTIYAYDGLEWGSMVLFIKDLMSYDTDWTELRPDAVEDISGHSFYKFTIPGGINNIDLKFSNESGECQSSVLSKWYYPEEKHYLYINGPFDEEGNASLEEIDDPASFDPHPYVSGPLFSADFEDENSLSGWTLIDADGDGFNWNLSAVYFTDWSDDLGHNGSRSMLTSESYSNAHGELHPNNWAFTPAITLGRSNTLSFWLCGQDADYAAEHIEVYLTEQVPSLDIISSGSTALTLLMDGTIGQEFHIYTKTQTDWQLVEIPIPVEFNGKTVYFGLRHCNVTDMFVLDLDDLEVTCAN